MRGIGVYSGPNRPSNVREGYGLIENGIDAGAGACILPLHVREGDLVILTSPYLAMRGSSRYKLP